MALVLSRKKNEAVLINGGFDRGGVTVTLVEIRGDKCRLAFDAPRETTVHREEVHDAIERENRREAGP